MIGTHPTFGCYLRCESSVMRVTACEVHISITVALELYLKQQLFSFLTQSTEKIYIATLVMKTTLVKNMDRICIFCSSCINYITLVAQVSPHCLHHTFTNHEYKTNFISLYLWRSTCNNVSLLGFAHTIYSLSFAIS